MSDDVVAEVPVLAERAAVHEHGWQSWSPTDTYAATATSARPAHGWQQTMRFRPGAPPPATGFQGEGLLAVDPGDGGPWTVVTAPEPAHVVPSVRARLDGGIVRVSADGEVTVSAADSLGQALAAYGEELAARYGVRVRAAPTVWCSWYQYFLDVTEADIDENLAAIAEHDLPVDVVQVDDGWQAGIGDWLTLSDRFRSLPELAARIRDAGRRAGIWVAPFVVGSGSALAREHPDWLVGDAGHNWGQHLRGLDLSRPDVLGHLRDVFGHLVEAGFDYLKLDFLYAGALRGDLEAYRAGLQAVRDVVGTGYVVGCGAPLLPSIGLVDAMRVSPDTVNPTDPDNGSDMLRGRRCIESRAWQQGRLWVNDADCLVARPGFAGREELAAVVERWSGLRSVSDRVASLDARGLALTRQVLAGAPPPTPFDVRRS